MTADTAKTLIGLLNKSETLLMRGQIQEQLGPEAFAEAINRGFLVPDYDTGGLRITDNLGLVEQIRSMAGTGHSDENPLKESFSKPTPSFGRQFVV